MANFKELVNSLPKISIKRRYLMGIIIVADILAALVIVWLLRPVFIDNLSTTLQNYSLIVMNPQKRYLLSQGDYLQGKAIPNTQVKALFTPGKIKTTAQTDSQGNYTLQIPKDLDPKVYKLTVANFDKNKNLAFMKGFRTRLQSNNKLLQNKYLERILSFNKLATPVSAQDSSLQEWKAQMAALGVYTYCEKDAGASFDCSEDELLLTDRHGIEQICLNIGPCAFPVKTNEELIQDVDQMSSIFTNALIISLLDAGYDPIPTLYEYGIYLADEESVNNYLAEPANSVKELQTNIEPDELGAIINQVIRQSSNSINSSDQRMLDFFVSNAGPFVPAQAMVDCYSQKKTVGVVGPCFNTLIGLLVFINTPETKALDIAQSGIDVAINLETAKNLGESILEALRNGSVPIGFYTEEIGSTICVGMLSSEQKSYSFSFLENVSAAGHDCGTKNKWFWQRRGKGDGDIVKTVLKSKSYIAPGFNIYQELGQRKNHFVEVGGPTDWGYRMVEMNNLDRKLWVSNVDPKGCSVLQPDGTVIYLPTDLTVDATNMQFADDSLGAVFASCLDMSIRSKTISESARVLEGGGLLIWQGGRTSDLYDAIHSGLMVKQSRFMGKHHMRNLQTGKIEANQASFDFIFQKPVPEAPSRFPVVERMSNWKNVQSILGNEGLPENKITYFEGTFPVPPNTNNSGKDQALFDQIVLEAFRTGRAAVIDNDMTARLVENHYAVLNEFRRRSGRQLLVRDDDFYSIAHNGYAYYVADEFVRKILPEGFGSAYLPEMKFLLATSSFYQSNEGLTGISHEIFHAGSNITSPTGFSNVSGHERGVGGKDEVFTAIYELMMELWTDLSSGTITFDQIDRCEFPARGEFSSGGYATVAYPRYPDLIKQLCYKNPNFIYDFLEFGINVNADTLVSNVFGNHDASGFMDNLFGNQKWKPNYENFLRYFNEGVGIDLTAMEFADDPALKVTAPDSNVAITGVQVQGDTITINTLASKDGVVLESARVAAAIVAEDASEIVSYNIKLPEKISQKQLKAPQVLAVSTGRSIDSVNALVKVDNCLETCVLQIPSQSLEGYKVVVYLLDESGNIITTDEHQFDANVQELVPPLSEDQPVVQEPVSSVTCPLDSDDGEYLCDDSSGLVCKSEEYECSEGLRWFNDYYKDPNNNCELTAKVNQGGEWDGKSYHTASDSSCQSVSDQPEAQAEEETETTE